MRHRIIGDFNNGLGNPSPCVLDNEWRGSKKIRSEVKGCLKDGVDTFEFLKKLGGCDFKILLKKEGDLELVSFGYEPAYMYEHLYIVSINLVNKEESFVYTGYARGAYGSDICGTIKQYKDYKRASKFTRFVDKWYETLSKPIKS